MNQTVRTSDAPAHAVTEAYLHDPLWRSEVSFETAGGSERLFTVLIANDVDDQADPEAVAGIAIIDTATGKTVCDGLCAKARPTASPTIDQRLSFGLIETMTWPSFSAYVQRQPTYRGGFPDIDGGSSTPETGSSIDMDTSLMRKRDLRTRDLKMMHMSPEFDYAFPSANREKMIADISRTTIYTGPEGCALAWDIRMNFSWDRTGHMAGGGDVDPDFDAKWLEDSANGSETFESCCNDALEPYTGNAFVPLEREGAAAIMLEQRGAQGGFLALTSIGGQDITFEDREELAVMLEVLDDDQIVDLWASCRALDVDLGRAARAEEMAMHMHEARVAYDELRSEDLDFADIDAAPHWL